MRKIIISDKAKQSLFTESFVMDKKRGEMARKFRMELKQAIANGSYRFDSETNTIYLPNYKYTVGKKFAETLDGEPIPLHYTYDTVQRMLSQLDMTPMETNSFTISKQQIQENIKHKKITEK